MDKAWAQKNARCERAKSSAEARTNYEASAGARTGSAVRKTNCQFWRNSGEATFQQVPPVCAGVESSGVRIAGTEINTKANGEMIGPSSSTLYRPDSTALQPSSWQSEFTGVTVEHCRNSNPGMDSRLQCIVTGTHASTRHRPMYFLRPRTWLLIAQSGNDSTFYRGSLSPDGQVLTGSLSSLGIEFYSRTLITVSSG